MSIMQYTLVSLLETNASYISLLHKRKYIIKSYISNQIRAKLIPLSFIDSENRYICLALTSIELMPFLKIHTPDANCTIKSDLNE